MVGKNNRATITVVHNQWSHKNNPVIGLQPRLRAQERNDTTTGYRGLKQSMATGQNGLPWLGYFPNLRKGQNKSTA